MPRHNMIDGDDSSAASPAATSAAPILTVRNLWVTFAQKGVAPVHAVRDVSFALHAREILGIVGESGSGKTTLGRCIAGFVPPTSGTVELAVAADDRAPSGSDPSPGVQMVFQESATALNPRLLVWKSVAEALSHGRSVSRSLQARALEELQRVGLTTEQAMKLPRELSGGQRQRVGIARALASGARIIVCDEAVSALDVSVRARVLNLLSKLRRELGVAIVFISHDIGVVAHLSERMLVMQTGRVVEQGRTRDIIDAPASDYTKHLLASVPDMELC